MKLIINYAATSKGYNLEVDSEIDIQEDAEALGYITTCLHKTTNTLLNFAKTIDPKYFIRLKAGAMLAREQKEKEQNEYFPFTTFITKDE